MGVYIKNMEKPKRCGECDLWSNCFYPKNPYTEKDDYIADDCPLIEIPTPHGRLIDASTKTTIKSMSGKVMDVGMLLIALKQYVPTILGEEKTI